MLEIHTAVVNNPEWIELQYMTLKTFLQGDWKYVVLNDAKSFADYSNFGDTTMRRRIQDTCSRLNIACIPLENENHREISCAATRCYHALHHTLDYQKSRVEKVLGLDSDMFLMNTTHVADLYRDCTAAIVPQQRTHAGKTLDYFWNGLYYFDYGRIGERSAQMDWKCNDVEGVWTDVGGGMHTFLQNLEASEVYRIPHLASGQWEFEQYPFSIGSEWLSFCMTDPRNQGAFFSEIYDERFLHFRGGGNWERRHPVQYKEATDLLRNTITSICRT